MEFWYLRYFITLTRIEGNLTEDSVKLLPFMELHHYGDKKINLIVDLVEYKKFSGSNLYSPGILNSPEWSISIDRDEVIKKEPHVFDRYLGCKCTHVGHGSTNDVNLSFDYEFRIDKDKFTHEL